MEYVRMNARGATGLGRLLAIAAASLILLGASGCQKKDEGRKASADALVVIATSDLRDVEPLAEMIKQDTGVEVSFNFGTTMGSIEAVIDGTSGAHAAWFANAKWLMTDPKGASRVLRQERIMTSPLVVGVCTSKAKELGWDGEKGATWRDVAAAAESGKLSYAMSNPVSSNQGFMAVMGVAAAFSGKGEALTAADVDEKAVAAFFKGYKGVGDNSTDLARMFKERHCDRLNAFVNYESWLMTLNESGELKERLTLVYPNEGVATADYPFMLLDEAAREKWTKVADWLRGEKAQEWLAKNTKRRPVNPEAMKKTQGMFPSRVLVELPFSPDRKVADALMEAYLNDLRRPIATTFVLDVSGSMGGSRIAALSESVASLTSEGSTLSERLSRFTSRERVRLMPFSSEVGKATVFEIGKGEAKQSALRDIKKYAQGLSADGGTSLYDAVYAGLTAQGQDAGRMQEFSHSVVVMTDGERTSGMTLNEFRRAWERLPESAKAIPVFPIAYGEGNEKELSALAEMTGGKMFDARKESLRSVFRKIRAYQ